MFVAKIVNGAITETGDLSKMYPNTSFSPNGASDNWMASQGVQHIIHTRDYDRATQKLSNVSPYIENGVVYDVQVVDLTADEIAEKTAIDTAKKEQSVRDRRDALLAETDYLALSDNTLTTEMAAYRQALRDITSHANFPDINYGDMDGNNSDWPTKP